MSPTQQRIAQEQGAQMQNFAAGQAKTATEASAWQLKQQQEEWEIKKQMAGQSGQLASQFLTAWTGAMGDMKGMYQQAFDALSGEGTGGSGGSGYIKDIADQIGQEYQTYRDEYGGYEKSFMDSASQEAKTRAEMVGQLGGLTKADYAGAEGRASADVRAQSEIARQSEARRMMSMGVDPSSGKFGSLSRKSALDEARNTAIAMNVARRGEKERVSDLAIKGINAVDPTKSGKMALDIRQGGTNMLTQQAGVAGKAADVETARIKGITDLTSSYGQNIVSPMGEMAGYMMGQSGGLGAISMNTQPYVPTMQPTRTTTTSAGYGI